MQISGDGGSDLSKSLNDIERIHAIQAQLESLKREYESAVERLTSDAERISYEALDRVAGDDYKYIASLLYWDQKRFLKVRVIAEHLGVPTNMVSRHLYPAKIESVCPRCHKTYTVQFQSMAQIEWQKRQGAINERLCDTCEEERKTLVNKVFELRDAERAAELSELKSMPYSAYLKTDHWKKTRASALRRAGNRCQICNRDDVQLHVHHRTYVRRGEERASDLIVLCADCHKTFHDNGKLAKAGGEA